MGNLCLINLANTPLNTLDKGTGLSEYTIINTYSNYYSGTGSAINVLLIGCWLFIKNPSSPDLIVLQKVVIAEFQLNCNITWNEPEMVLKGNSNSSIWPCFLLWCWSQDGYESMDADDPSHWADHSHVGFSSLVWQECNFHVLSRSEDMWSTWQHIENIHTVNRQIRRCPGQHSMPIWIGLEPHPESSTDQHFCSFLIQRCVFSKSYSWNI